MVAMEYCYPIWVVVRPLLRNKRDDDDGDDDDDDDDDDKRRSTLTTGDLWPIVRKHREHYR